MRKIFNLDDIDKEFRVTRNNLKWVLNPSDSVQRDLFWLGVKDLWDVNHIKKLINPGNVIFDIGANFGYYSITLANSLRGNCVVYAFEPFRPNYERLLMNIKLNQLDKCIYPFQIGISDTEGEADLITIPGNSGGTYINPNSLSRDVKLVTIDSFCHKHNINKIDFMKIDVEGYELRVLKGAKKVISETKPIIFIELNPLCLKRVNSSVHDVVNILYDYGYVLFISKRKRLMPLRKLPDVSDCVNAFCFHKNKFIFYKNMVSSC